mmetsp:Transcript_77231/g.184940  ORF Transcript_77231/g.184940 Transcript_77231/m.184940 type:complete len:93 (-) Transcript_77231:224-502(-)
MRLIPLVLLGLALKGCENGCDHSAASQCTLGLGDCADLAQYGGCIKTANCCDSSDKSAEASGMTSWRKRLNELFDASELAGNNCEASPCVTG